MVKDKKEDKKNKGKAKESTEPEANEENHSENGEAKSNAVQFTNLLIFIFYKFSTGFRSKCLFNIVQISTNCISILSNLENLFIWGGKLTK